MSEAELRPIARRGMTADELELKRYAARELRGHPRCLLIEIVERRGDRRQRREAAEETEPKISFSIAAADA